MVVNSHKGRLSVRNLSMECKQMRKLLFAFVAALMSAGYALAEGSNTPDFSAATTALTDVKTQLVSWVGTAMPILTAIAGAFLVFWLGKKIFRIIKSWAGSSS